MDSIAVRVRNVSRELFGTLAVNDISLNAGYGMALGLLGPNGAGKTTTLRMLAGLLAPGSGTIEICGKELPSRITEIKNDVGFLTGGMKLYESLSPRESLRFFGRVRGMEPAALERRIAFLIEEFEMADFCDKRFSRLSAGEKQRSTIANTVLHDPRVLILDEITLSLDVMSSQFILDFIKREKERGKCVIFSTHIMSEAEYLCDEIALINRGRIIDRATARELLERTAASNLTEAFVTAVQRSA